MLIHFKIYGKELGDTFFGGRQLLYQLYSSSPQRAQSELAAHQKKILHVDNHVGISIAGLTADARLLW